MFFTAFVLGILRTLRMFKLKTEGQRRFTENLTVKLQKLKSDIFTKEKKRYVNVKGSSIKSIKQKCLLRCTSIFNKLYIYIDFFSGIIISSPESSRLGHPSIL